MAFFYQKISFSPAFRANKDRLFFPHLLEEGTLFLAHGMSDDNVHFQNSAKLVEAMNFYGKQYDFYPYPNRNHNIATLRDRYHIYVKMTKFLIENLVD